MKFDSKPIFVRIKQKTNRTKNVTNFETYQECVLKIPIDCRDELSLLMEYFSEHFDDVNFLASPPMKRKFSYNSCEITLD